MLLLRVYQRVVVHVLLNTRAFLCHFGLPLRTLLSGSEDVRTWDTIWTQASVKALASGRSTRLARAIYPLRVPDKLSIDPTEHLDEQLRYAYASAASLSTDCSLLLLTLHLDRH